MIAEIIPAIKLPRQFKYFDYLIPEKLDGNIKIGQIVQIPFRGKKIEGVVYNFKKESKTPKKKLKSILRIYLEKPVFDKKDIELIKWFAHYYFVSWGLALKQFIPEIPQKKSQIKEPKIDAIYFPYPKINISKKTKIFYSNKGVSFFQYQNIEKKLELLLYIVKKNIKLGKQTLILSSTLIETAKLNNFFVQYFNKEISLLLNNLPKGTFYNGWLNILENKKKIILGTRSAIFAPLKNIGTIIFNEEFSENFKQEEPNPRYDARSLALQINKLKDIQVIFSGSIPRLETFYQIKNKNISPVFLKKIDVKSLEIVNLKDEMRGGNYSLISEKLEQNIKTNLHRKKQVILFLNRKGGSTYISCKDCGYVFLCPNCKLPLVEHNNFLKCHHCNKIYPLPLNCPKCRGINLNFSGKGTQKIELDIKKRFPQVKYLRLDKDTNLKNLTKDSIKKAEIIIGTKFMWQFLDWQNIGLIGILNFDNLISYVDFRAKEKQYQFLANLSSQFKDKIIIQTYSIDNSIFNYIKNGDWQEFYNQKLKIRKTFFYPPYSHLIKLIYQNINEGIAKREVMRIYTLLRNKFKDKKGIDISQPNQYFAIKLRNRYRWNLVIKVKKESWENVPELLKIMPADWLIDIDPQNLF